MSLPFTSVVSYHTNPLTCGVARFSKILAEKLGVPFAECHSTQSWGAHPLLSWKWSEIGAFEAIPLIARDETYSVFWHDGGEETITGCATHVFYADPSLGSPGLWCPPLIDTRRPVKLFSFGMGHKLQADRYRELREALGDRRFHLRVSVGLHEGQTLSEATAAIEPLKQIMGPEHVTFLGCLSDEAIVNELHQTNYLVAFFEHGARLNNTTLHAAFAADVPVVSNIDAHTDQSIVDRLMAPDEAFQPDLWGWSALITEMAGIMQEKGCVPSR